MTIREKINFLEALETVLEQVERLEKSEMDFKTDENGDWMTDENGDYIRIIPDPNENPICYNRYKAFEKIKKEIEKLADK